jgi:SAM-dependent methyltransferase
MRFNSILSIFLRSLGMGQAIHDAAAACDTNTYGSSMIQNSAKLTESAKSVKRHRWYKAKHATVPKPWNYEAAYDYLYENYGYHADLNLSHEGPAVEQLYSFAKNLSADQPPLHTVIVLGCSHGKGAAELHQYGFDTYGIDVAKAAIKNAQKLRGKTCSLEPCFIQGSLTDLPYADSSIDAGMSVDVLEHIAPTDVPKVVEEISRVVQHYLVVQVADFVEMSKNGEKAGMTNVHLTVKGAPWWINQFSAKGWTVVADNSDVGDAPFPYVRLLLAKGIPPAQDQAPFAKGMIQKSTKLTESLRYAPGTCRDEPENNDCTCENEGDFATGNHCMKMSGAALAKFQEDTSQDFDTSSNWCVCLHLWEEVGKPAGQSFCGEAACAEVGGCDPR